MTLQARTTQQAHRAGYIVSTDPAAVDVDLVWRFLRTSYWATDVPRSVVERAVDGSMTFSLLEPGGEQLVGFGRVVTDRATFAYVADLFVLPAHRGQGLARYLVRCMRAHPQLQGLRAWMLGTRDAHGLYAREGFEHVPDGVFMRIYEPYS